MIEIIDYEQPSFTYNHSTGQLIIDSLTKVINKAQSAAATTTTKRERERESGRGENIKNTRWKPNQPKKKDRVRGGRRK